MALTEFQRDVCRLLAGNRIRSGESYVAGGVRAPRVSRDLDLFHDTAEALDAAWRDDRAALEAAGCGVEVLRDRAGLVEARSSAARTRS